jgi:uncharacterized membrane protein
MLTQAPTTSNTLLRTSILGFATGLRSQLPLALMVASANRGNPTKNTPGLLHTRTARLGTATAALGEFVADKTPFVPARTNPGPFAGRLVFGALTGAIYARTKGASIPTSLTLAAAAAALGTLAGYQFRTTLTRETGLPDLPFALAEDLLAFTLSYLALRD